MTDEEYYEKLYRLTYIVRYSNVPRVKNEDVAQHSFLVSAMLFKLWEEYRFDLGLALRIAVAHDILESETSDVCHIMKKEHPDLYDALKKAEKTAAKKFPHSVKNAIDLYDRNKCVESKIVHLADAMQCKQYAENEIKLGSSHYFNEVKTNSIKRINFLKCELKDHYIGFEGI